MRVEGAVRSETQRIDFKKEARGGSRGIDPCREDAALRLQKKKKKGRKIFAGKKVRIAHRSSLETRG